MTRATEGWPFLVARGRHAGYRTLLAPPFLVDENEHHVLAESTGGCDQDGDGTHVVDLDTARVGPFSIAYTSERVASADVEPDADDGQLATDEHGRPLEVVYGIVSRDRLEPPLDPEDRRTVRERALESYRGFLADEQWHRVDASVPFALRTRSRPRPAGPERVSQRTSTGARLRRPSGRGLAAILAAAGTALIVSGSLIFAGGGTAAPAVSRAWLEAPATGRVRYCTGERGSGSQPRWAKDYNRTFSRLRTVVVATSTAGDTPRNAFGGACDVVSLDVAYTAELASRRLLYDMTPYVGERRATFDARIMRTADYDGRLWGVPKQLDVGVLFYRKDRAAHPPRSWADVFRQASRVSAGGRADLRFALTSPEDLTVVLLELAYTAGAHPIVTSDGRTADIDQPQLLEAINLVRDAIPGRATSAVWEAGSAVSAYETGRASFLRAWPFVASRLHREARTAPRRRVAANTRIVALPPWNPGGRRVGILDGRNLVIPRAARNPSGALHLIDYLTSPEQVREDALENSRIPVLEAVGHDPAVRAQATVRAVDKTMVLSRPAIPRYAEVSKIISSGVLTVLRRPDDRALAASELRAMQRRAQRVLDNGSP